MTVQITRPPAGRTEPGPVRRRAWTITILLLAFMLVNFADKAVLGFAGVQIMDDLDISARQFGLLQSGFFWLFAVGAVTVGALSARVNPRWLVAGLMLVWVLTMVPLIWPVSFAVLLGCRILLGYAEGPAYALATHVVHSWFPPEKRGLPASVVTAGASIGPLIAAPLLTWVIVTWSWHAAFGVLAVTGLVWFVLWLVLSQDPPQGVNAVRTSTVSDTVPVKAPLRVLLTTGTVVGIGFLTFFAYLSTTLKVSWLPLYMTQGLGYDAITSGRLITLPYAVAAVAAIGAGLASNALSERGVALRITRGYLAGGLVVAAGASMYLFTTIDRGPAQMVFITLAFSLNSAAYAVAFTAIGDVVHPERRGTVLGCLVAFYSMAGVLAPLVLGYLVDAAPDPIVGYGHGFATTGILMVVGGALAILLVRPERDLLRIAARVGAAR